MRRTLALLSCLLMLSSHAEAIDDPCGGPSALLNIIDRPTVGDSACAVPLHHAVLETGYEYQQLRHSAGHQQNFPEAELRIGLPLRSELVMVLPNYLHQTGASGFAASTVGIKHEFGYTQNWLATAETLITLPDGSATFGSKAYGVALNGIVSYTFNPQYNLTLMLGGTTQTTPSSAGGQRYNSINPDLVFTYSATPNLDIYAEVYAQSNAGPGLGNGANFDGGLIYLLMPRIAVDMEIGHHLTGNLNTFNQYLGAGISFMY